MKTFILTEVAKHLHSLLVDNKSHTLFNKENINFKKMQ